MNWRIDVAARPLCLSVALLRLDIGGTIHAGANRLEIKVADLWVNRLIGDAQPGVTKKITFTTVPTYRPDAPLRTSGLIGPVNLFERTAPR
jgi:(4-O-methyl)-D-glucuronate---lignin esterase